MSSVPYQTVLHDINGTSVSQNQNINIAPGERNVPVSFSSEPNWEALASRKEYTTCKNHFNETRVVPLTLTKYAHARLKYDDWFPSNPQYIFYALDRDREGSSMNFT